MTRRLWVVVIVLAVFSASVPALARAGDVNPAFGRVAVANGFSAIDVAVQPDGGIVVLAEKFDVGVELVRLTSGGEADPSFGDGGTVTLAEGRFAAGRVAVSAEGRIAATFSTSFEPRTQAESTMVLLDDDGTELARTDSLGGTFGPVAYTSRGVVAGTVFGTPGFVGYQPAALRVDENGAVTRLVDLPTPVRSVGVDSVGRIVLGLFAERDLAADHTYVVRLLPDGRSDATFGFGGIVSVPTGVQRRPNENVEVTGGGIAVDGSDRVVVSGSPPLRLLTDGREDPSFDARSLPLATTEVYGTDGRGGILLGSTDRNLLVRLTATGGWDTSFGRCGATAGVETVVPAGSVAYGISAGAVIAVRLDDAPPAAEVHEPGLVTVADTGAVRTFGGACFAGAVTFPLNRPVVTIETTPSARGYWLAAGDGGIFTFGDARFFGSTGALRLNQPVVTMASTPSGRGYWLVASDGGVFTFGDAPFLGSLGALRLNQPIVGMTPTATGLGYWLVAADGGVFTFGDATYHGSAPARGLRTTVVDIARTPTGRGYWLLTIDGDIVTFGDAANHGGPTLADRIPTALVAVPGGYVVAYDRNILVDVLSERVGFPGGFRQGWPGSVVDAAYAA